MGGLRILPLLFADDIVLLALSNSELLLTLVFSFQLCELAEVKISTSKSEATVLSRKREEGPYGGVQVSQGLS